MQLFIQNYFNIDTIVKVYPLLLQGLVVTIKLTLFSITFGMAIGMLIAVLRSVNNKVLNVFLTLYVDIMRAFPPLVLLILIFYALPFIGIDFGDFTSAVVAFTLNTSGYYGEIFRAGIESIPRGQIEAARSTGLNGIKTMLYIVLPQAVKNVIPPLVSNTLEVIKGTSIASAVALPELLRTARIAQGLEFNPTPLTLAALVYLVLLWPLVRLVSSFQRQMMKIE